MYIQSKWFHSLHSWTSSKKIGLQTSISLHSIDVTLVTSYGIVLRLEVLNVIDIGVASLFQADTYHTTCSHDSRANL